LLALGKPQAVISEETAKEAEGNGDARHTVRNGSTKSNGGNHKEMREMRLSARLSNSSSNGVSRLMSIGSNEAGPRRGMVLPFTPLSMSFDDVNYYVDMPAVSLPMLNFSWHLVLFPVVSSIENL
jgi:hypothetical protein